jgi:hypothetical protein
MEIWKEAIDFKALPCNSSVGGVTGPRLHQLAEMPRQRPGKTCRNFSDGQGPLLHAAQHESCGMWTLCYHSADRDLNSCNRPAQVE